MTELAVSPLVNETETNTSKLTLASLPNDTGRAARFVDAFGEEIRFVHEWQTWLTWEGNRWRD